MKSTVKDLKGDQKPKKQLNPYIRFTSIAIQMGLTIYLGSKLGEWLDVKFDNKDQLYFKIVTLVAVFIAMYVCNKTSIKINK